MPAMGVHENIDVLKRVQEADREIYGLRQELASMPDALRRLIEELEQEKSRMAQLETQQKEIQLRQRKKEGELSEKEGLIRKYDTQLSQVKTNKEYSALQQEITSLKADGSMLEDEILAILDEIDQVQRQVREERERLVRVEQETEKQKAELKNREDAVKASLTGLNQKRSEIISQVTPETRELYEKIVEKKEGLALVRVDGEVCAACRITIRPQLLNEIKLGEAIVLCEHCSRILYLE